MKKIITFITAVAIMLGSFVFPVNADVENKKKSELDNMTLLEVQAELAKYLEEKDTDIIIGSEEYTEYISRYLEEKHDEELKDNRYYEQILIYMSEYLAESSNSDRFIEQNGDDITLLLMTEEIGLVQC